MTGVGQLGKSRYCVICRLASHDANIVRVVGPFDTQAAAVEWAVEMRSANPAWNYTPDVMHPPPLPTPPKPPVGATDELTPRGQSVSSVRRG